MRQIAQQLYVGTVDEIKAVPDYKIVNLAHTYHYSLHDWQLRDGIDHTKDPCYVICEDESNMLSVNWIDGAAKYFDYNGNGVKVFKRILSYIDENRRLSNVLIACNKGESRAPSIGMLYLAKYTAILGDEPDYVVSREKFTKLYPGYLPGHGITEFLIDNWHKI